MGWVTLKASAPQKWSQVLTCFFSLAQPPKLKFQSLAVPREVGRTTDLYKPRGTFTDPVNSLFLEFRLPRPCSLAPQPWGGGPWVKTETDTVGWGGCSVPRGRGLFEDPTRPGKQQQLGQELKELTRMEQALDQLIHSCSLNFKHLTEDKANKRYPPWLGRRGLEAGGLWHARDHPELMQNLSEGADPPQGSGVSPKKDFLGSFSSCLLKLLSHDKKKRQVHFRKSGKWRKHSIWRKINAVCTCCTQRFNISCFSPLGFTGGSDGKASVCSAGDPGSIPGSGRSPGEGNGNPPQYSCLEKSHGRRSLVGYSRWGRKELDMTERLYFHFFPPHSILP